MVCVLIRQTMGYVWLHIDHSYLLSSGSEWTSDRIQTKRAPVSIVHDFLQNTDIIWSVCLIIEQVMACVFAKSCIGLSPDLLTGQVMVYVFVMAYMYEFELYLTTRYILFLYFFYEKGKNVYEFVPKPNNLIIFCTRHKSKIWNVSIE